MVGRLGVPALGLGPVGHDDHVVARGRVTLPAIHQVEQVAAHHDRADRLPHRPDVVRRCT